MGDVLLKGIADVQSGALEAGKANAMANLARAYVSVYQFGDVERRIAEIEQALKERAG